MRKFNNWLKRLSLSQQLFMLIFMFIAFFVMFFFLIVSRTVEAYTETQMITILTSQQSIMVNIYENQGIIDTSYDSDSNFLTLYYVVVENEIVDADETDPDFNKEEMLLSANMLKEIKQNVLLYAQMDEAWDTSSGVQFTYDDDDSNYAYYSIVCLYDGTYMVSVMNSAYPDQFREELLDNVINVTILVVGIFFIFLMLWVTSIIHPLNQIRSYIEKIKLGKPATLKVNREDEIGELANALVSMNEELQKQEKTKEEMIHNISHDLKTPIATIKSYAESIKDGIYPYDTLEKSIDVIIRNADRLEKKVYNLLVLNRIDYMASQEGDDIMCDMKDVVENVLMDTKVMRPEIEIEANLTSSYFRGSDESWRVAVENILENALRYAETQIVITLDEEQLCIYNDGPFFKEGTIESMFKPFEKGQGGKFGLGLSIVQKVVSTNKYRIVAENVETGGVIFKIMK